jgi:predicted RNase H-like nuclease (RuvC/YqgF family)
MTDFERIEQAIAEQERELQRLESEIREKRKTLEGQRQALALLRPLLIAVLGEPTKVLILEPDSVRHESIGMSFRSGRKV